MTVDNTMKPFGWRGGSRIRLEQRPVKDEAESDTEATYGSDLQVPSKDSPVVTAAKIDEDNGFPGYQESPADAAARRMFNQNNMARGGGPPKGQGQYDTRSPRAFGGRAGPGSRPPGAKVDNHKDAQGSTKHHGRGLQVMGRENRLSHGPGGKNVSGQEAAWGNTRGGEREPIWHGDRAPRFKNVEDPDPDFRSVSGDQVGRNEAEDTTSKPGRGSDWRTKEWGAGGSLPLHGRGRRPSLGEPGYHAGKKQPLGERQTEAHPIFDRALVQEDTGKPSGARPGQPAEHLHVQRPSAAHKALEVSQSIVRKFTTGASAIALDDEAVKEPEPYRVKPIKPATPGFSLRPRPSKPADKAY